MNESEVLHMNELAELRERVMELQTKDSHTPQELAELEMLRHRVLGFQVLHHHLCFLLTKYFESNNCTLTRQYLCQQCMKPMHTCWIYGILVCPVSVKSHSIPKSNGRHQYQAGQYGTLHECHVHLPFGW